MTETITLSLISHTNAGKTTLARTLLRRDIGEVLDQPHVTVISEAHTLLETPHASLKLWDTPGFGDTARLLKRLRGQENPIGWFLHQVWDRIVDRPLWCSQEAVRNVREEADVVLYLVNAAEDPGDAGYVALELEILTWMDRPVILLLNQTGSTEDEASAERGPALEDRWRSHVARFPIVKQVLSLDAFTRCWIQEAVLFEEIVAVLPETRRAAMRELLAELTRRHRETYDRCVQAIASYLAGAAGARHVLDGTSLSRSVKSRAMTALAERLDRETRALTSRLIDEHGLEGTPREEIEQDLRAIADSGEIPVSAEKGALVSGILGGAAGGILADLKTGGLMLGTGTIIGAALGALGGYGLLAGYQYVKTRGGRALRWTPEFLMKLTARTLLRYLAIAHFGRGRGSFVDGPEIERWRSSIEQRLGTRKSELERAWKDANEAMQGSAPGESASPDPVTARLAGIVESTLTAVLSESYPRRPQTIAAPRRP